MKKNQFLGPSREVPLWALLSFFSYFFSPVFLLFFLAFLVFHFFSFLFHFFIFGFFSCSFMFFHVIFGFFHVLSCSFIFLSGAQNLVFFLGLNFVTIALASSNEKNQFLGPSRGTPLGPLFLFFSRFFVFFLAVIFHVFSFFVHPLLLRHGVTSVSWCGIGWTPSRDSRSWQLGLDFGTAEIQYLLYILKIYEEYHTNFESVCSCLPSPSESSASFSDDC